MATAAQQVAHDLAPERDDVPPMPLRTGEPLSDPFAKGSSFAPRPQPFELDEKARALLSARWDGTTATAVHIGDALGGVPGYKVIAWARELGLKNTVQPTHANGKPKAQDHPASETPANQRTGRKTKYTLTDEIRAAIERGEISRKEIGQRFAIPEWRIHEWAAQLRMEVAPPPPSSSSKAAPAPSPATPAAAESVTRIVAVAGEDGSPVIVAPEMEDRLRAQVRAIAGDEARAVARGAVAAAAAEQHHHEPLVRTPLPVIMNDEPPGAPDYRILHDMLDLLPADGVWSSLDRREHWLTAFRALIWILTELPSHASQQEGGATR